VDLPLALVGIALLSAGKGTPFGGSFSCPATIGNKTSGHRDTAPLGVSKTALLSANVLMGG